MTVIAVEKVGEFFDTDDVNGTSGQPIRRDVEFRQEQEEHTALQRGDPAMLRDARQLLIVLALLGGAATPAWADPVRNWIGDSYRQDRKAINQSQSFNEDQLRHQQDAFQDRQRDAWKAARRKAPPQVRAELDRNYNAQRKSQQRQFDSERAGLRSYYNNSRAAIHDDYRQSLRNYEFDRRNAGRYYVPLGAPEPQPFFGPVREEIFGTPELGVEF